MERHTPEPRPSAGDRDPSKAAYGSNLLRLSGRQWAVAAALTGALFVLIPIFWERVEPLGREADYRIPYRLGHDYWTFERHCRRVAKGELVPLIGDSVVWGHYVSPDETLTHYLNALSGGERFANLSINGIHPAAMSGLVRYHAGALRNRAVVLHFNFLWLTSKQRDLQTSKEFAFQHPALVAQFFPRIPCYKAPVSMRLGIVLGRRVSMFRWANHLRIAYFGGSDLPAWTLDEPYANLARAVTLKLPSPGEPPTPEPVAKSWTAKDIRPFGADWVAFDESFQWRSFRRTIDVLERRGNRVFVVVGPYNEHMLKDESLAPYRELKRRALRRLDERGIPHLAPDALPSELYADSSHPLPEGYAMLARRLLEEEAFRTFLQPREADGVNPQASEETSR